MMNLIGKNITRQFLRQRQDGNILLALDQVSITISSGKLTVLHGHSGSGKSTLIHVLSGLLTPSSGNVLVGDQDLYQLSDTHRSKLRNEQMGIIPQVAAPLPALTILENVLVPIALSRKVQKEDRQRAKDLLNQLQIGELGAAYPSQLSGGELRRMAVARALIAQPQIILADEPTADLDPHNSQILMDLLKREAANGACVLVVTHDPTVIQQGDVLYELIQGKIEERK